MNGDRGLGLAASTGAASFSAVKEELTWVSAGSGAGSTPGGLLGVVLGVGVGDVGGFKSSYLRIGKMKIC